MYNYCAYRLGIHSELPFPELPVSEQAPDIIIRLRRLDSTTDRVPDDECFLGETQNVGMFLVRGGREIVVDPVPGVDESVLRSMILGPILVILLRQRGLLVLHASGVVVNGFAIGFLGGSGAGKSTLAEAFYAQGYSVVDDDVMAVQTGTDPPTVLPSYPYIKLLPDAMAVFGYPLEKLSCDHTRPGKRIHPVPHGFAQTPLALKRLYVLTIGTQNEIALLRPQDAFVELVRHSRAAGLLKTQHFVQSHFRQCVKLVEEVPICRLKRQPSLSALWDTTRLVAKDLP